MCPRVLRLYLHFVFSLFSSPLYLGFNGMWLLDFRILSDDVTSSVMHLRGLLFIHLSFLPKRSIRPVDRVDQ